VNSVHELDEIDQSFWARGGNPLKQRYFRMTWNRKTHAVVITGPEREGSGESKNAPLNPPLKFTAADPNGAVMKARMELVSHWDPRW
jgi:hypothetical protein